MTVLASGANLPRMTNICYLGLELRLTSSFCDVRQAFRFPAKRLLRPPFKKIINQITTQTKSLEQKQHNPRRVAEKFMCL